MPDLYANYAELSAAEVEGVDYTRTATVPAGATWASIAIHGGAIEAGSGEMARQVADARRMAYYEFAGIKASGNSDLHITSTNFDEPMCLDVVASSHRILSWHGYTGTLGVAETAIGGLDGRLRDLVVAALTAAGFTVVNAPSEIAGTDPDNICNAGPLRAGLQLEMSRAQREAFFPGGDLSQAMRESGQRTETFHAYADAVVSAMVLALAYDDTLSRVRLTGTMPGVRDTFTRTVVDDWGTSDSGHTWLRSGGSAVHYQVSGGLGRHVVAAVNASRWCLTSSATDVDVSATVGTDVLAAGGGQFCSLVARSTDDGATCYLARLEFSTSAAVILTLRKRVSSTETFLVQHTTGLTHVADTRYAVRLQVVGDQLQARAWLASDPEPTSWQLTTTDADVTGPGRLGVRSILSSANTNTLPVNVAWDDITTHGTAVVQRSANAITWGDVRGGIDLDGTAGATLAVDDYEFYADVTTYYRVRVLEPVSGAVLWTDQDSIVATLDAVWLKSLARPFLNRAVSVSRVGDVSRPARTGLHEVVGRSYPVAVTDLRGSARWEMVLRTTTAADADTMRLVLGTGDILLIHVPAASTVPGGYVTVGDTREHRFGPVNPQRQHLLPLTEVAAPGPDVVGATVTWQGVINEYATWADLIAAEATWADVLELIGDPSDVVVP